MNEEIKDGLICREFIGRSVVHVVVRKVNFGK